MKRLSTTPCSRAALQLAKPLGGYGPFYATIMVAGGPFAANDGSEDQDIAARVKDLPIVQRGPFFKDLAARASAQGSSASYGGLSTKWSGNRRNRFPTTNRSRTAPRSGAVGTM